jgi:hypothetical protein
MDEHDGGAGEPVVAPAAGGDEDSFWTLERKAALDARLDRALVAQRDAFDGGRRKLSYLEGHTVIAQLNRLFGYGGWSYSLDAQGTDEYTDGPVEGWYAQFWAVVTLRVGDAWRQDVGTAEVQNTKRVDRQTGEAIVRNNVRDVNARSTARKGAITDGLKRCARSFGEQFGNSLYDQDDNIYSWMAAHRLGEELADERSGAERSRASARSDGEEPPEGAGVSARPAPTPAPKDGFAARAGAALGPQQGQGQASPHLATRAATAPSAPHAPQTATRPQSGQKGPRQITLTCEPDKEPARPADPLASLRAQVVRLCEDDGPGLDLLRTAAGGRVPADWTQAELEKALPWLQRRRARNLPPSVVLGRQIAEAGSAEDVRALQAQVEEARAAGQITQAEWAGLQREAKERHATLAAADEQPLAEAAL